MVVLVLLVGFGLTAMGCSQSDTTSSAPGSSNIARSDFARTPGSNAPEAAPPSSGASQSPSAATTPKEVSGKVVSADPAKKTLVMQSDSGEMKFEVKDNAAGDLQTVKPGDNVTVQYTEDAGKYSAEALRKG